MITKSKHLVIVGHESVRYVDIESTAGRGELQAEIY